MRHDSKSPALPLDPELDTEQRALQCRLAGTNINPSTFLATDYLNHFNEVIMLLEMLPEMPEMIGEVLLWQPKSYPDHFRDSGFKDGALAIEAYERAPARYRRAFDHHVAALDALILESVAALQSCASDGTRMRRIVDCDLAQARRILETLSGIIHGATTSLAQDDVDRAFADASSGADTAEADGANDQAAIDALFD
ncbi:MAG: hypothetical protein D6807_05595 [Alphaproteobacteria bacterium]|nr:MAG: hypothetical protein D6807_05595 [Alphaproteobacteria bacterium]